MAHPRSPPICGASQGGGASWAADDQMPLFLILVESVARLHGHVDRGDFRSGAAADYWVPLLSCNPVIYGAKDPFIDDQWTTEGIARQFTWLADRFAGKPAIAQCP
jgi:hypothetical protein